MPLTGYMVPGVSEVLDEAGVVDYLFSANNLSAWTPAMFNRLRNSFLPFDLTAETLVAVCPREHQLRLSEPYTVSLERLGRQLHEAHLLTMASLDQPSTGVPMVYGKRLPVFKDREFILPGSVPEVVSVDGTWTVRLYKPTRRVPSNGRPYEIHARLLGYLAYLLSALDESVLAWDAERGWWETVPVAVTRGEVVYSDGDHLARTYINLRPEIYPKVREELLAGLRLYTQQRVGYLAATRPVERGGHGFAWKCEFCPVRSQCHELYLSQEIESPPQRLAARLSALGWQVSPPPAVDETPW